MIAVIVPVLNRPHRAALVNASIHTNTTLPHRTLFVCTENDNDQIRACIETLGPDDEILFIDAGQTGEYARKINHAYRSCDERLVFLAADDLEFQPGWDVEAVKVMDATGAGVVGTNDLSNGQVIAGLHSTHSLVRRGYIDACGGVVGQPGVVLFDGYSHQQVDNELVQTAMARGCYAHAHDAVVQHVHPLYDRTVQRDATYVKGQAKGFEDRRLFESRRHLWLNEVRV